MHDLGLLIGRLALTPMFLWGGWGKLNAIAGTTSYFTNLRIPMPGVAVYASILAEIGLPLLIILGLHTRLAAVGLLVFTLAATWFGHPFWTMEGAAAATNQILALKNLAIAGGLLILACAGGGRFALRPGT